jgi:hypothetical protein
MNEYIRMFADGHARSRGDERVYVKTSTIVKTSTSTYMKQAREHTEKVVQARLPATTNSKRSIPAYRYEGPLDHVFVSDEIRHAVPSFDEELFVGLFGEELRHAAPYLLERLKEKDRAEVGIELLPH